jgi:hypothetical protein
MMDSLTDGIHEIFGKRGSF